MKVTIFLVIYYEMFSKIMMWSEILNPLKFYFIIYPSSFLAQLFSVVKFILNDYRRILIYSFFKTKNIFYSSYICQC